MKLTSEDEKFMRRAIRKAKEGVKKGQTPFGACIVKDGKVLSCAHNTVWHKKDITSHAEVQAIRDACKKTGSVDLSGAVIYSTCEPCPMCFGACHWAKISTIVYGANIQDARKEGFNELSVSNRKLKTLSKSKVKIIEKFLREENVNLFAFWKKNGKAKPY